MSSSSKPGSVLLMTAACAKQQHKWRSQLAGKFKAGYGGDDEAHQVIRHPQDGSIAIVGGGPLGVLYGAYKFAELALGVHYSIGGDLTRHISWQTYATGSKELHRSSRTLFAPALTVRGINPFHDFNEGPDLWSAGNYKAYSAQMAKMRFNQIALHGYNQYNTQTHSDYRAGKVMYAEPSIWLGPSEDVDPHGKVLSSYANGTHPVTWKSTCIGGNGLDAYPVGSFAAGAPCAVLH